MRNFYDILGVSRSANTDEIKQAYFNYLRQIHPDKRGGDLGEIEAVGQAKLIWSTLKEAKNRVHYDNWLREQELRSQKGTVAESIELLEGEDCVEEQCRCGDFYQVTAEEVAQIVDRGIFECGSCSLCLELLKR